MRTHLFTFLFSAASLAGLAQEAAAPVRDMVTDRPDTTESPITVPKGVFQVEASFFDYTRDMDRGTVSQNWILGQVNFKAGLADDVDLQIVVNTYANTSTSSAGVKLDLDSFGDVTVRLKKNLWGNDGGKTAFGIMPYVTIPTDTDVSGGEWNGGIILPLAVEINDRLGLGLMVEADFLRDPTADSYDVQWLTSASLGIGLTEQLGMYLELVAISGTQQDFQGLFDTGLTYNVTDNLMFDAGVRIGMNRAAPDIGVFTGVSFRF